MQVIVFVVCFTSFLWDEMETDWLLLWLFRFFYTFEKFVCDMMGKWVGLTAVFVWSDGEGGVADCSLCVWTDGEGVGADWVLCVNWWGRGWADWALCVNWWARGWGWLSSLCELMRKGVGLTELCWQPSRAVTECDIHLRVRLYLTKQARPVSTFQTNMHAEISSLLSFTPGLTSLAYCSHTPWRGATPVVHTLHEWEQLLLFTLHEGKQLLLFTHTHSMKGSNSCCLHTPWRGATRVHTLHRQLDEQLLGTSYQLQWSV